MSESEYKAKDDAKHLKEYLATGWTAKSKRDGDIGYITDTDVIHNYINGSTQISAMIDLAQTFTAKQTFAADLKTGLNKKFILDDDDDTYIFAPYDDQIRFVLRGSSIFKFTTASASITKLLNVDGGVRLYRMATPAPVANYGFVYGKDVAASCEIHVLDGAGNETQISAHNKFGRWIHKERNKHGYEIECDMLGFFMKHGKKYLRIKNIESEINKISRLRFIKRYLIGKRLFKEFIKRIGGKKCHIKQIGA